MTTVIHSDGLSKSFRSYKKKPGIVGSFQSFFKREYVTKSAVQNFNLNIKKGEIIGLLGPNGAGKTTLMKMFTGIIVPSSGELEIQGHRPWERSMEFRKKIALVMGQKSQLWWDIPAMDSFHLLKEFYELSDQQFSERIEMMSSLLQVKDLLHVLVRKQSLGERMKLELMASLLHTPEVIFLDEPTIGLDLVAQDNIRKFIKDYHQENNCTIIITSHYMADVQALCDRLVLIMEGKKGFDGPIEQFQNILGKERQVSFTFETPQEKTLWQEYDPIWDEEGLHVELRVPMEKLRPISAQILENYKVLHFGTEKMPIERVMKELMVNPQLVFQEK